MGLPMSCGLGWALKTKPIAHCGLGCGPGHWAHLWAIERSTPNVAKCTLDFIRDMVR